MSVKSIGETLSCVAARERLGQELRGEILDDSISRALYSTDASFFQVLPAMVILPRDARDVQLAVRFAAEAKLPIAARGAGSGLAGESLTRGIVLDFSRYCTGILDIGGAGGRAAVEMGVALQHFNDTLAPHGWLLGPDPSSANRATIGGVLGNNATGAHSIRYGYASDHAEWLDVVLADGTRARFHRDGRVEGDEPSELRERIMKETPRLLEEWAERIEQYWPKSLRNRAGYALRGTRRDDGTVNWTRLLCGSEGTLAIFTAAGLKLNRLPAMKALVLVSFDSLGSMARALPSLVATGCAACELMDAACLDMTRQAHGGPHPNLPEVAALLVIEQDAESEAELREKLDRTKAAARDCAGLVCEPKEIADKAEQLELWTMRKKAEPLLFRRRQAEQPVPFIEDVAVDVPRLAEYMEGLDKIFADEHATVAYYAHAGSGELHIRPFLDLHGDSDRQRMVRIAERTFELAWRCGGTVSGEHGCGRTRTGFLPRQYGPVYELMRLIKGLFDPEGRLNPGKIITDETAEELMTTNLRFDNLVQADRSGPTELRWAEREIAGEVEACNGCAECRAMEAATMCPVFRALNTEQSSPRGKTNLLRQIFTGQLDESLRRDEKLRELVGLCIQCKSCRRGCPSAVNVPKLMQEAKSHYARHRGLTRAERVLSDGERASAMGSLAWPVSNATVRGGLVRRIMQAGLGIDRRRKMPSFGRGSFVRKARRQKQAAVADPVARAAYFADIFVDRHDHALGWAVLAVLRHNGVDVTVPVQKSAAMPAISYGRLDEARDTIRYNLEHLTRAVEQGYEIVCSEPSAALCLKEEWGDLLDDGRIGTVSRATSELMQLLLRIHKERGLKAGVRPVRLHAAYHAPCHLKALHAEGAAEALLSAAEGLTVETVSKGCCGMAGTFGMQAKNYDLSMQIGRPMLEALRATGADVVISECSTCRMQIEHGTGMKTIHPVMLLAQAYGLI